MHVTTTKTHHTYVDAEGVTIHYYVWAAPGAKAVVQLAHGLGEYAGRYEYLAQALVAAGYSVYADDHRGHGQTGLGQVAVGAAAGGTAKLGKLGAGGLLATVEAIRALTAIAKSENPGLPVAILGHSWGSLMLQRILNEYADDYDAAVLTGTAHRTITGMNAGQLNAKHKHLGTTGYEWLSRDPAVSRAFLDDPQTFYADVLKLFGLADGLRLYGRPTKTIAKDIPLLIMIGNEDSVGGEKSVYALADDYIKRSRLTDVEVNIYQDDRHEIFNEPDRDRVNSDLIEWLDGRLFPVA